MKHTLPFFLLIGTGLMAQDSTSLNIEKKNQRFRLSGVSISTGHHLNMGECKAKLNDFRSLCAPGAPLEAIDKGSIPYVWGRSGQRMLSGAIEFKLGTSAQRPRRPSTHLRIGATYYNDSPLRASYSSMRKTHDSITSNGQNVVIDSTIVRGYLCEYTFDRIRFEATLLHKGTAGKRGTVYIGLGASLDLVREARTDITFRDNMEVYTIDYNNTWGWGWGNIQQYERIGSLYWAHNQNSYGFSFFAPVGLELGLGKSEPLKYVRLFVELKPSLSTTKIPECRSITNFSLQSGFGLRIGG